MNAYEKLLAEAVPTGTFGRARPAQPRRGEAPRPAWTREEQAAHLAALEAALAATGPTPPPDACSCPKCKQQPAATRPAA